MAFLAIQESVILPKRFSLSKKNGYYMSVFPPFARPVSWRIRLSSFLYGFRGLTSLLNQFVFSLKYSNSIEWIAITARNDRKRRHFGSLCTEVPTPSEKKSGEEKTSLLPIFSEGGRTSVHRIAFWRLSQSDTGDPVLSRSSDHREASAKGWCLSNNGSG